MKRSRAIQLAVWFGLTSAAFGCAQIAGLTGDYQLGVAGGGGVAGSNGGALGASGRVGVSGDAGASDSAGASDDAGAAGANGGTSAGASGGVGAGGGAAGSGIAGAGGGAAGTGIAGGSSGSAGTGVAGAGGGSAVGPVRIGFSEFHDSAAGSDNASSHLADATFAKPAGTAAGDFILVFFGADHELSNLGNGLTTAGWKLLDQHAQYGTDGQATYLIYKLAGASEPDPIVFAGINNVPSGDGVQGLLSVYRGVNASTPINAYEVTVEPSGDPTVVTASTPTPPIKTTVANCLLIAGFSPDTTIDAPVISSWPQGFVENQMSVNNPPHPYPFGWANIYSAERHLPAAGTVSASAFGWSISNGTGYFGSLAFVLALAP